MIMLKLLGVQSLVRALDKYGWMTSNVLDWRVAWAIAAIQVGEPIIVDMEKMLGFDVQKVRKFRNCGKFKCLFMLWNIQNLFTFL